MFMFHEEVPHTWTASSSLLKNWRFPTHFFHKYRLYLCSAASPWLIKHQQRVKFPALSPVQLTHWQAEFYSCLIDMQTMMSRRTAAGPNARERHNNLSLQGFFLTTTRPHHTARWLRTSDFQNEPPNLKKLSYISGLCNESVNTAWTT